MPNFRTHRMIGWVVKTLVGLFVFAVIAVLLWRIFFSANIPDTIDTLAVNEDILAAYEEHGEDIQLLYQDQGTVTRAEHNYGYFSVPKCTFIPEANQVQVVFRYNNSTLSHLATDYELGEIPSRDADLFDVTLVRTTDTTPDDKSDNTNAETLVKERFFPTDVKRETTSLYTYYLYVFEDVSVEELTAGMFVDIYYNGDIDYEKSAYGTLCIYAPDEEWLNRTLTGADKKALEKK